MKATEKTTFSAANYLASVGKGRSIASYRKNDIVFSQGGLADAVFHIQKGKVKIAVLSVHGKEAVAAVLGMGEFFGEGCLTGQSLRISTATAMTDAKIMRLEKTAFARSIDQEPALSKIFVSHLLARTIRNEADLVDQLSNSSEKRLARLLLILANYGSGSPPEPIISKITQETLAEMIGTTRSRVSFFMNRFRKLGYIDYNGRIEVKTELLNAVLRDNPHIQS